MSRFANLYIPDDIPQLYKISDLDNLEIDELNESDGIFQGTTKCGKLIKAKYVYGRLIIWIFDEEYTGRQVRDNATIVISECDLLKTNILFNFSLCQVLLTLNKYFDEKL